MRPSNRVWASSTVCSIVSGGGQSHRAESESARSSLHRSPRARQLQIALPASASTLGYDANTPLDASKSRFLATERCLQSQSSSSSSSSSSSVPVSSERPPPHNSPKN